jgi:hypothetical protein
MKDKHSSEVIYALADYKQLVLAYRTKHAELVKSLTFWKTSVAWICAFMIFIALITAVWLLKSGKAMDQTKTSQELLKAQVNSVTEKLSRAERELAVVREDLNRKDELIKLLEKNISTTSKNLLEKLLSEQEETAAAK